MSACVADALWLEYTLNDFCLRNFEPNEPEPTRSVCSFVNNSLHSTSLHSTAARRYRSVSLIFKDNLSFHFSTGGRALRNWVCRFFFGAPGEKKKIPIWQPNIHPELSTVISIWLGFACPRCFIFGCALEWYLQIKCCLEEYYTLSSRISFAEVFWGIRNIWGDLRNTTSDTYYQERLLNICAFFNWMNLLKWGLRHSTLPVNSLIYFCLVFHSHCFKWGNIIFMVLVFVTILFKV